MDYNTIAADNLNSIMREIAEYTRMAEEITVTLDGLKDTLKKYMDENGLYIWRSVVIYYRRNTRKAGCLKMKEWGRIISM